MFKYSGNLYKLTVVEFDYKFNIEHYYGDMIAKKGKKSKTK